MSGALAYANCMRSHGVPDFPDPNGQGEFQLHTIFENGRATKGADLDPSSPVFQAGERACGSLGSAGRQVTKAQEARAFQQALQAAACMRANGVPDYPDPTGNSQAIHASSGSDLNPANPTFQAVSTLCTNKTGYQSKFGAGAPQPGSINIVSGFGNKQ